MTHTCGFSGRGASTFTSVFSSTTRSALDPVVESGGFPASVTSADDTCDDNTGLDDVTGELIDSAIDGFRDAEHKFGPSGSKSSNYLFCLLNLKLIHFEIFDYSDSLILMSMHLLNISYNL